MAAEKIVATNVELRSRISWDMALGSGKGRFRCTKESRLETVDSAIMRSRGKEAPVKRSAKLLALCRNSDRASLLFNVLLSSSFLAALNQSVL